MFSVVSGVEEFYQLCDPGQWIVLFSGYLLRVYLLLVVSFNLLLFLLKFWPHWFRLRNYTIALTFLSLAVTSLFSFFCYLL